MDFEQLLNLLGDIPVFESALLLAGDIRPQAVRLQLTRWTRSGRLIQLRRGLYVVAPPYQKVKPHPFLVANLLQRASYISLQSALAFHGIIPETVPATLSVTTGRPRRWETPLGVFEFRHIQPGLLSGYRMTELQSSGSGQQALVATPEKALLDLVYLQPGGDSPGYLGGLRLQALERLDPDELRRQAGFFNSPKLNRAVKIIIRLAREVTQEFKPI
jgi:predicted transcriptional regulator of viral defense system